MDGLLGRKIKQSSVLIASKLGDEALMLNMTSGQYFSLDSIAWRIWSLIEEPASIAELSQSLSQEYDVSGEVCRQDVTAFAQKLLDNQLVEFA